MRSCAAASLLGLLLPSLALAGCDSEEGGGTDGAEGSGTTSSSVSASSEAPTTAPEASTATVTSTTAEVTSGVTTDETTGGLDDSTGPVDSSSGGQPVGSPGCGAVRQQADGEHQLVLDKLERRYILRLPQNYDPTHPYPLIFALHGNGSDPDYWDSADPDRDIRTAFADEAILIIPEAINNAWRDYDADSKTWPAGIELELNFFDTVYETAQNELCVDTDNVFSMGFSGGGSFSGVLGCHRDYIRAMAVGGSVIYFDQAACTAAPAAWITIGDGELEPPREAFRDFFVESAGCQETSTPGAPEGCVNYEGCGVDTPVTFCSHPAGHVWPSIGTEAMRDFFRSFYAPE